MCPGADETAAEFWGFDGAGVAKRMTGGTSFANVTLEDAISTNYQNISAASLNGKLFLAFDSTQDLLHVYDPNLSSPKVRRVGCHHSCCRPYGREHGGRGYLRRYAPLLPRSLDYQAQHHHRRSLRAQRLGLDYPRWLPYGYHGHNAREP
jgi:hypothetical protein